MEEKMLDKRLGQAMSQVAQCLHILATPTGVRGDGRCILTKEEG